MIRLGTCRSTLKVHEEHEEVSAEDVAESVSMEERPGVDARV